MNQRTLRRASLRFLKPTDIDIPTEDTSPLICAEALDSKPSSQLMVQQLHDYAKNSKFFSELDPKAQQTCIEHMFYQFCKAGEVRYM